VKTVEWMLIEMPLPRLQMMGQSLDPFIYEIHWDAHVRRRDVDRYLGGGAGGQHGAYGAGFLRGWRTRAERPMPRFDLVTGVSTGGLQAPFALLGTEAALETLARLYREAATGAGPTPDWLFWLRRTGGVVSISTYKRTIERAYDETLRAQLRTEFEAGRQLVIATTDLDLGIGRLWDLERAMGTTADGLARAHALLLATSASPASFRRS
jgi:hypothetical protein